MSKDKEDFREVVHETQQEYFGINQRRKSVDWDNQQCAFDSIRNRETTVMFCRCPKCSPKC